MSCVYGRSPAMMILPYMKAENKRRSAELRDEIEHGIKVCWNRFGYKWSAYVPGDSKLVWLVRFKPRRQSKPLAAGPGAGQ